jgi:hypothetical protein
MKAYEIGQITFTGPAVDDREILARMPGELAALLEETNGFILFHGGLHVRGAVRAPAWHSLRHFIEGEDALHKLYPAVAASDIPFAEDCVGDQFLLKNNAVWCLRAETGALEKFADSLNDFWNAIAQDPYAALNFGANLRLEPGQLLLAYPPFCTQEAKSGTSLKPLAALELIRFHADLAKQLAQLPKGARFKIAVDK